MLYRCHFFHISEFFLDMRYYLVVLMVIQVFWDVKLCQLVYSLPAFWRHVVSLTSESTQSKYYWFYLTLKMGSLHSSESSLSVYQLTLCVTSHNI